MAGEDRAGIWRRGPTRTVAAVLALLIQGGLVAFFGLSRGVDRQSESEADLILIQLLQIAEAQRPVEEEKKARRPRRSLVSAPLINNPVPPSEESTAITVAPVTESAPEAPKLRVPAPDPVPFSWKVY